MRLLILSLAALIPFASQALGQESRAELWGGLREGMNATEVEGVLRTKPEISSAKVRKEENRFDDDAEIRYRGSGIMIGDVPAQIRINMNGGRLHSVTLFPEIGVRPTCLSAGRQAFGVLEKLLATKYTATDVAPPQDAVSGEYIQRAFANESTYVFDRLYVSRARNRGVMGRVAAARCVTDDGATGTASVLYLGRSSYDISLKSNAGDAARKVRDAASNL